MFNLVQINDPQDLKNQFIPIQSHWNKRGLVRFIPLCYMYRELERGNLFLLVESDVTIGILWLTFRERPYKFVKIEVLALHPDHINRGLGKEICQFIITTINDNLGLPIELDVKSDNNLAIKFYKTNGFKVTGTKVSKSGVETLTMKID